ncbi:YfbU family protein [Curtobacterium sp. NPDC086286]|jgi:uncharacterized protein YfbU (UPF0304 family)|uniref:YfbU family protein n=1 Tax=Curtobacterium sp. NPDC086286 TaxID=3363964 RepID=UPI00380AF2B5
MSKVITTRVPDDAYDRLESIAIEHGLKIGEHTREVLLASLDRSRALEEPSPSSQATVPERLTTVERHTLATLHRILARLVDGKLEDGDRDYQLRRARILEEGWVGEYPNVFAGMISELPRRDSGLVMDILDMFRVLESSFDRLSPEQRDAMSEGMAGRVRFAGFDANDDYEGALLTYAEYLISIGKWSDLAYHLADEFPHDGGNSHGQMVPHYRRMLEVYTPIWRERVRSRSFDLTADEIQRIASVDRRR